MKKIITLILTFFLASIENLHAQSFDDYYFNKYNSNNNKKPYKKLKILNTDPQNLEIVKHYMFISAAIAIIIAAICFIWKKYKKT